MDGKSDAMRAGLESNICFNRATGVCHAPKVHLISSRTRA